jgi:PAS domain S-box-containing protein
MSAIPPGYLRVDEKGIVLEWDKTMSHYLGYSADDIVGQSMALLIAKSYQERHWKGFNAAIARGAQKHHEPAFNGPLRHKDGTLRMHSFRQYFLRDPLGKSVGAMLITGPELAPGEDNGLPSLYTDALELADQ